jgi:HD-GYP domain-containing protein (c-di-GMP phosphodiesterase class II)
MSNILELAGSPVAISLVATIAAAIYSYIYLPRRMGRAYRMSLLTLARAVEAKDLKAAGHGERVAAYIADIARQMRIPKKLAKSLEYAAFLQDVGNIRVPHAVLNKPGRLTDEEMRHLQSHTVIGAEIVEQVRFIRSISPVIRHHHEAWDGSGYPDGLQGEQIPVGARILAVATAFDAMTSERPYHDKKDEDAAVTELREAAGQKFDPAVVEAFLRVLQRRHRAERPAA